MIWKIGQLRFVSRNLAPFKIFDLFLITLFIYYNCIIYKDIWGSVVVLGVVGYDSWIILCTLQHVFENVWSYFVRDR